MKRPLCIFCLAVSAAACLISPFIKNNIRSFEEYSGSAITLSGKVYELESYKSSYSDGFNIYLEDVSIQDPEPDTGNKKDMRHCKRVIVYLKSEYGSGPENVMPCHIGQRITVCGKLKAFEKATNEGMFDALLYYNTLGISFGVKDGQITERTMRYDVVKDMLNDRRQRMAMILDEMLPAEDAGIMKTMLLGLRKEMDKEQKSLYRRSGIAHVLCISGLHISILGMGIFRLLKKTPIGIKASAVTAFFAVLGYVLMTGLGASSVRALVMFGFSMLAVLIGHI